MKTNYFQIRRTVAFACALATLLTYSCSNDDNIKERSSELSLTISGSKDGSTVRSAETVGAEGTVNRISIGVFNSDGSANTIAEYALGDLTANGDGTYSTTLRCSPGTGCSVVVVANVPAGTFSGDNTKTDFLSELADLQQTSNTGYTDQLSTDLPMSGESTSVNFTANSSTNANVSLSRLVARITLSNVSSAFVSTGQYAAATFRITKVFIFNAMKAVKVHTGNSSETFPGSPEYYSGGTVSGTTWTNGNDFVRDDFASPFDVTSTVYSASHFFYALPNPSTNTTKTKLVIGGIFDQDGSGTSYSEEVVYYPIVINKNQTGTTITEGANVQTGRTGYIDRNTIYNLTAVIKGKGVSDPSQDIEPADLNLTVEVAPWSLTVTQNVVFE